MKNINYLQEVTLAEKDLLKAIGSSDISQLDTLLHDDLLFTNPTGQTISKEMDLQAYRSGEMQVNSIESSELQVALVGDNAVVAVTIKLTGTFARFPLDGIYRYTRVWKKFDNNWKVIAGSCVIKSAQV